MQSIKLRQYIKLLSKLLATSCLIIIYQNCGSGFQTNSEAFRQLASQIPVVQILESPAPLIKEKTVFVKFKVDVNKVAQLKSTLCQLDLSEPIPCADTFTASDLADGDHILRISARDSFDNLAVEQNILWRVDATNPSVVLNTAPVIVTGANSVNYTFTATDNLSGVFVVECSFDNAPFAGCISPQNFNNLVEKNYVFKIRSKDVAGNISDVLNHTFRVDFTAPIILIATGPENLSNLNTASFTFSGTDNGIALTQFECQLDANGFQACSSPQTYNNLGQGNHTFTLKARDSAGNMSAEMNRMWNVDSIAPTINLVSTPLNPTNLNTATFQFTPNDGVGSGINRTECSLNGGAFNICTSPQNYNNLDNGSRTFTVRAVDNAGNVTTPATTFTWVIDSISPQVNITSSVQASTELKTATMTITTSDTNGTGINSLECKLDAAAFATCASPVLFTNLNLGDHTFMVRVSDKANNMSSKSFEWTIIEPNIPNPTPEPPPQPPAIIDFDLVTDCNITQCFYVRPGAGGNGSNWMNAYSELPDTLVRGATYFLADGTYNGYTFDDANSGSKIITIKKATKSDHGTTNGWLDSYGDGQAVFSAGILFATDFWEINGTKRNDAKWDDGPSYGIKIPAVTTNYFFFGHASDDVTLKYLDIGADYGNADSESYGEGLYLGGFNDTVERWLLHKSYVHNVSVLAQHAGVDSITYEYNFLGPSWSKSGIRHQIRGSNCIYRFNVFKNACQGHVIDPTTGHSCTAIIGWYGNAGSNGEDYSRSKVYGNLFIDTLGDVFYSGGVILMGDDRTSQGGGPQNCAGCAVYNNTFTGAGSRNPSSKVILDFGGIITGSEARNNIFHNFGSAYTGCNASTCSNNALLTNNNAFLDAINLKFTLKADGSAGAGFPLPAPFNLDMNKKNRGGANGVWDLGAFEF